MASLDQFNNKIQTPEKSIVFLVYGSITSYHQTIFSILTLYFHLRSDPGKIRIIVYTDNSELLEKYLGNIPLTIRVLSEENFKDYKGQHDFNHRMKIFIIEDCMREFNNDVFYVDGDTFFLKNPLPLLAKISPEISIMHAAEYDMHSTKSENYFKLILRRTLEDPVLLHGESVKIPLTSIMWNAGVIGMSHKHIDLLKDVVSLTDQIYGSRPVHTAEQFAFSYVLQTNTTLISADEYIRHYWSPDEKVIYNKLIKRFLSKSANKAIEEFSQNAYNLAVQHNTIKTSEPSILDRLIKRINLTINVALKGRLN